MRKLNLFLSCKCYSLFFIFYLLITVPFSLSFFAPLSMFVSVCLKKGNFLLSPSFSLDSFIYFLSFPLAFTLIYFPRLNYPFRYEEGFKVLFSYIFSSRRVSIFSNSFFRMNTFVVDDSNTTKTNINLVCFLNLYVSHLSLCIPFIFIFHLTPTILYGYSFQRIVYVSKHLNRSNALDVRLFPLNYRGFKASIVLGIKICQLRGSKPNYSGLRPPI